MKHNRILLYFLLTLVAFGAAHALTFKSFLENCLNECLIMQSANECMGKADKAIQSVKSGDNANATTVLSFMCPKVANEQLDKVK